MEQLARALTSLVQVLLLWVRGVAAGTWPAARKRSMAGKLVVVREWGGGQLHCCMRAHSRTSLSRLRRHTLPHAHTHTCTQRRAHGVPRMVATAHGGRSGWTQPHSSACSSSAACLAPALPAWAAVGVTAPTAATAAAFTRPASTPAGSSSRRRRGWCTSITLRPRCQRCSSCRTRTASSARCCLQTRTASCRRAWTTQQQPSGSCGNSRWTCCTRQRLSTRCGAVRGCGAWV